MSEGMLFDRFETPDAIADDARAPIVAVSSERGRLVGEKVLVTGATGFVGAAVVRQLARRGCVLRTLARATSARTNLEGLDVEIVEGDLRDAASVTAAIKGVRYLFHAAADYRLWARDPSEILDTNVRGTQLVMEAALAAGVERVVYTSSVATLEPCRGGLPSGEDDRLSPGRAIGTYKRSKVLAETLVDQMVDRGLPAVIVHPSTPIGPGDVKPTPTGRIIVEAAHGRIPAFVETGLNLVHVDDVAEGHVRALEHGRIGERYILGGQNVPFSTMLGDIATLMNRRAPKVRLPHGAIYPLAYAAEAFARITGREPFLSLDSLRMSKHLMYYSSSKAQRELGYRARSYQLALNDALLWFARFGYTPTFETRSMGPGRGIAAGAFEPDGCRTGLQSSDLHPRRS